MLGDGEWRDVPISRAVAASTALPLVYEPVEIKGREMMDGGIRSTTNIDIAVEKGAKFIVVVNPIVPFVNDFTKRVPTIFGSRVRRISDMGFVALANQAVRMIAHDRLHRAVEEWEIKYPGVDILLIEPEFGDELMFSTSIMDYKARLQIAKHGFESVTLRLARDYDRYKRIAERHGIEISARRIKHVLDQVERERDETPAWRRVFEQTTGALLAPTSGEPAATALVGRAVSSRRSSPAYFSATTLRLTFRVGRQLAALLREVVREDLDLLDLLDPGELLVDLVDVGLDRGADLVVGGERRRGPPRARARRPT